MNIFNDILEPLLKDVPGEDLRVRIGIGLDGAVAFGMLQERHGATPLSTEQLQAAYDEKVLRLKGARE